MCAKMDAICAEAFARIDALSAELDYRGFFSKSPPEVRRPIAPPWSEERERKWGQDHGWGTGGEKVPVPTPPPTMPPQAPAIDPLEAIRKLASVAR